MTYLLQQSLNALQLGSLYALIALGYTMVYGVLKLINFAHGDLFSIGAYLGLTLWVTYPVALHLDTVMAGEVKIGSDAWRRAWMVTCPSLLARTG